MSQPESFAEAMDRALAKVAAMPRETVAQRRLRADMLLTAIEDWRDARDRVVDQRAKDARWALDKDDCG